jgi:polysaccharide biosynthesis protein PslG
MVDHGDGAKQIWATEFGSPTSGVAGDGHVDEKTQAAIMTDAMGQWSKRTYAGPFFVFEFRDNGTNPQVKNDWFGLVSHDLTRTKPAYSAYRRLATG